ncbi:hypothetical protein JRO89_XS13G0193100 [Xanthoceras sorbifolium]|uniref:CASP-like protein n=1 Tax=Xanthoceras sorbifolium TaxID=99658 RepID=A0ABQ8H954_9ROSI|nr:hypothetical protein JRO89_XS13G0193100 [Xanthoceras sorbifolium]
METKTRIQSQTQTEQQKANTTTSNNNHTNNMKRSSSSNSDSHTHLESPHSPLRFHSPLPSDQGDLEPPDSPPYSSPYPSPQKSPRNTPPEKQNSKAIVAVTDKFTQCSPALTASVASGVTLNRAVRGDGAPSMTKVGPGGEGRSAGAMASILKRSKTEETVKVANLGFRLSEVVLCLISFSVMAADKTQGWAGDSFDRYREYRYCLSINVIGFAYSVFQAYDIGYYISTGKHVIRHHLRRPFDFFMDQATLLELSTLFIGAPFSIYFIVTEPFFFFFFPLLVFDLQILAYLLISAASAAATRVDDWQSNWGKDDFTVMASASVAMAFLAFVAFASSSLISGYNLCTTDAM